MALTDQEKRICTECEWRGHLSEIDHVYDPKPNPGMAPEHWQVCPRCRTPEHIAPVCDEPDCWRVSTCGFNTAEGYRRTCGSHYVIVKHAAKS